jgi:hypothetical protein
VFAPADTATGKVAAGCETDHLDGPMSALGHKQTFAVQKVMSALPPKADMCSALANVCFGPIADIGLFDHLVGATD